MKPSRCFRRAVLAIVTLTFPALPASADPIPLTVSSGFIEFTHARGGPESFATFLLSGPEGFVFRGGGTAVGPPCDACEVGAEVNLGLNASADGGSISFRGLTREFQQGPLTPGAGNLEAIARSVVLPSPGSANVVTFPTSFSLSPFSVVGLAAETDPGLPPAPEFLFQLSGTGHGVATFDIERSSVGTFYVLDSLRFDFGQAAPVPEPASVLLLGGALAGLWVRQRKA